jgi:hypothetical protein
LLARAGRGQTMRASSFIRPGAFRRLCCETPPAAVRFRGVSTAVLGNVPKGSPIGCAIVATSQGATITASACPADDDPIH